VCVGITRDVSDVPEGFVDALASKVKGVHKLVQHGHVFPLAKVSPEHLLAHGRSRAEKSNARL